MLERNDAQSLDRQPDVAADQEQTPALLVDPSAISLELDPEGDACVMGREFLGREWLYRVEAAEQQMRLLLPLAQDYRRGTRCRLRLRAGESVLLYPHRIPLVATAES